MLFVIAMDVLNNLLAKAYHSSLLEPIGGPQGIPHRLFLFVNDAVVFVTLVISDLQVIRAILQVFGEASGLHTNLSKSSISPISCTINTFGSLPWNFIAPSLTPHASISGYPFP